MRERGFSKRVSLFAQSTSTLFISTATDFPPIAAAPCGTRTQWGCTKVYQRICEFHQQHGELWEPAPLLKRLAESGSTFAEFDKRQAVAA